MNVPDDLSSLDGAPRAAVPWDHPDADPLQDMRDFAADDWVLPTPTPAQHRPTPLLLALGRRLADHPHVALVALHVPILGRLVAAAAEAEWRDTLHGERKARGLD